MAWRGMGWRRVAWGGRRGPMKCPGGSVMHGGRSCSSALRTGVLGDSAALQTCAAMGFCVVVAAITGTRGLHHYHHCCWWWWPWWWCLHSMHPRHAASPGTPPERSLQHHEHPPAGRATAKTCNCGMMRHGNGRVAPRKGAPRRARELRGQQLLLGFSSTAGPCHGRLEQAHELPWHNDDVMK